MKNFLFIFSLLQAHITSGACLDLGKIIKLNQLNLWRVRFEEVSERRDQQKRYMYI